MQRFFLRHSQKLLTGLLFATVYISLVQQGQLWTTTTSTIGGSSYENPLGLPTTKKHAAHRRQMQQQLNDVDEQNDKKPKLRGVVQKIPRLTWNYTKAIVRPDDNNTAIAIVAMDESRNSFITERCVRSIRARGDFSGWIMIYTDELGFQKYNRTLSWDRKVAVVQGRPDDLQPKQADGVNPIKYRRHPMIYKRFKTQVLEYLDYLDHGSTTRNEPRRFDRIRYVLYIDVDNVIANPLRALFDDYYYMAVYEWENKKHELGHSNFSFFSLWKDPGAHNKLWQGGQHMHDRHYSRGCEVAWREQIDTGERGMDQPLLMNVVDNFEKYKCVVFELPGGEGSHFDLLHTYIFKSKPKDYPTMVHITSVRVTDYDKEPQEAFIRNALLLNDGTMTSKYGLNNPKTVPIDSFMVDGIPWRDVTLPVGAGGIKHETTPETSSA